MPFEQQRDRALALLAKTGIWESNYAPPLLKALWGMGVKVPPPHFAGFTATALTLAVVFAVLYGGLMWVLVWQAQRLAPLVALVLAGAAGVLFGFCMAAYYAYGRRKHGLPSWESLADGSANS